MGSCGRGAARWAYGKGGTALNDNPNPRGPNTGGSAVLRYADVGAGKAGRAFGQEALCSDSPLINLNLGELAKPATVLIQKVSNAIGGIFKPYQIIRVAKAEAEADLIRAGAKIRVTDVHRQQCTAFCRRRRRNS